MAGKTYGGFGDGKNPPASRDAAPLIADEDDSQGLHSGPTVVDDKKVEEVLRKLRSLDKPPGPLTGITQMPADPSDSEPTRIETQAVSGVLVAQTRDPAPAALGMAAQQRPTAIGRSLSAEVGEQPVTVPADPGRGTMFGHSIHLPDINAPDEVSVEISSGGVQFLPGTPLAAQPFSPADRPLPPLAPPSAPAVERFHAPFGADSYTQLVDKPRRRAFKAVVALLGGAGLVGLIWFGANKFLVKPAAPAAPAPAAMAPAPPPAAAAPAQAIAPSPAPAAAPAAAAPAPSPAPAVPAAVPAEEPTPAAPPATVKRTTRRAAAAARRAARSAAAAAAPSAPTAEKPAATAPDEESAPAEKPSHGRKKAGAPEDPDGTMAPTM
ncbi:MAG TPA: hypothetical protein VIF57_17555 [Polyangia bacterium]